jgi:hypothetical protein
MPLSVYNWSSRWLFSTNHKDIGSGRSFRPTLIVQKRTLVGQSFSHSPLLEKIHNSCIAIIDNHTRTDNPIIVGPVSGLQDQDLDKLKALQKHMEELYHLDMEVLSNHYADDTVNRYLAQKYSEIIMLLLKLENNSELKFCPNLRKEIQNLRTHLFRELLSSSTNDDIIVHDFEAFRIIEIILMIGIGIYSDLSELESTIKRLKEKYPNEN